MDLNGYLAGGMLVIPADGSGMEVLIAERPDAPAGYRTERRFVESDGKILVTYELLPIAGTEQEAVAAAARIAAASFSDEDALRVAAIYDTWSGDSVEYHGPESPSGKPQDRLQFTGALYKVLKDHTSQPGLSPDKMPDLYARIYVNDSGYEGWNAETIGHDHIMTGDVRWWKGALWISLRDGNTSEPGTDEWWDLYES